MVVNDLLDGRLAYPRFQGCRISDKGAEILSGILTSKTALTTLNLGGKLKCRLNGMRTERDIAF